jgi:hypothetical protein
MGTGLHGLPLGLNSSHRVARLPSLVFPSIYAPQAARASAARFLVSHMRAHPAHPSNTPALRFTSCVCATPTPPSRATLSPPARLLLAACSIPAPCALAACRPPYAAACSLLPRVCVCSHPAKPTCLLSRLCPMSIPLISSFRFPSCCTSSPSIPCGRRKNMHAVKCLCISRKPQCTIIFYVD